MSICLQCLSGILLMAMFIPLFLILMIGLAMFHLVNELVRPFQRGLNAEFSSSTPNLKRERSLFLEDEE